MSQRYPYESHDPHGEGRDRAQWDPETQHGGYAQGHGGPADFDWQQNPGMQGGYGHGGHAAGHGGQSGGRQSPQQGQFGAPAVQQGGQRSFGRPQQGGYEDRGPGAQGGYTQSHYDQGGYEQGDYRQAGFHGQGRFGQRGLAQNGFGPGGDRQGTMGQRSYPASQGDYGSQGEYWSGPGEWPGAVMQPGYAQRGYGGQDAYGFQGDYGSRGGDAGQGSYGGYGSGASARGQGWRESPGASMRSRPRRGPKGFKRSDERLKEDICERLSMTDLDVSDVSVDVKDGRVTLEGTVSERHMKHQIEDLVDNCMGVQDVENRVRVQRGAQQSESAVSPSSSGATLVAGSASGSEAVQGARSASSARSGAGKDKD